MATTRKSNSSSSSFASSSTSSFSSRSLRHYFPTPTSTTTRRTAITATSSHSLQFRFSRAISPSRSISSIPRNHVIRKDVKNHNGNQATSNVKRTCMCSATTHPGSFRCSLHKNKNNDNQASSSHYRLNARRSAMTNSLVRIGTVEGDLVKRALASLIRPSSHHQRRRTAFVVRPSRLSVMSSAEDDA